jgi:uncharacterized protein Yka (UPF0111/DUF47 family)
MPNSSPSLFRRILHRIFPETPDFFALLNDQVEHLRTAAELLVEFMETGSSETGAKILDEEHRADEIKVKNLQQLSEAFSTPMDREDIYRAVVGLDEVVNYCKATVNEMDMLGIHPGKFELDMAVRIRDGVLALREGYVKLQKRPMEVAEHCTTARKSERKVERIYRQSLAELFQGQDYINMFKRREIYRHLSNAADRMAVCADTLQHMAVKMG